jgi:hypothetical protein
MKTRLFNRNVIFVLAVFCVIGAVAAAIKVQTAQRTAAPSGQSSGIQVGTATARPGGFQIQLDQPQLQDAMGKVNAFTGEKEMKQTAERQKGGVKYENISIFRSVVEKEATAKLNALFPRGVPPGTESKIKITIKVKLTDPVEISITIEF